MPYFTASINSEPERFRLKILVGTRRNGFKKLPGSRRPLRKQASAARRFRVLGEDSMISDQR